MSDGAAPENLSDDWHILRRKGQVDVPHTMDVGEALVRLTYALKTFLTFTQYSEHRGFKFSLEHSPVEGSTRLQFRVVLIQTKIPDDEKLVAKMIDDINKGPPHDSLEKAVEFTFNNVAEAFRQYNENYQHDLECEEQDLNTRKEELLKLRRNLKEMGHFDRLQVGLPFKEDGAPQEN